METQSNQKNRIFKIILYIVLFLGNIWCSIDSFCEYADTLHTKTLIKGIFFFLMIFWFAGRAITEYKLHKAKQKALIQK